MAGGFASGFSPRHARPARTRRRRQKPNRVPRSPTHRPRPAGENRRRHRSARPETPPARGFREKVERKGTRMMTTMSCSATSASVAPTLARANAAHPARATIIARAANPAASRTLARLSSRVAEVSRGLALSVAAGANAGAHARRISVLVEARGRGRRGGGRPTRSRSTPLAPRYELRPAPQRGTRPAGGSHNRRGQGIRGRHEHRRGHGHRRGGRAGPRPGQPRRQPAGVSHHELLQVQVREREEGEGDPQESRRVQGGGQGAQDALQHRRPRLRRQAQSRAEVPRRRRPREGHLPVPRKGERVSRSRPRHVHALRRRRGRRLCATWTGRRRWRATAW